MRRERFHNKLSKSSATLVIAAVIALLMWWWPAGAYSLSGVGSLALTLFVGYMLIETDIVFQLLRVHSRMIASVWLVFAACVASFHTYQPSLIAVACMAVSYHLLFSTYQLPQSSVDTFHSYAFLSLGGIFYPPMLLFVPFYFWYQIIFMRSMSLRTLSAALIGVIAPFWFWAVWMLVHEDMAPIVVWWDNLGFDDFSLSSFLSMWTSEFLYSHIDFFVFSFLGIFTSISYLYSSFDDKIRTRMMLYIYVFQFVVTFLIAMWQPSEVEALLPFLLLNVSVVVAHYFTFRWSWFSVLMFIVSILALITLALVKIYGNVPFISEYLTIFARLIEK